MLVLRAHMDEKMQCLQQHLWNGVHVRNAADLVLQRLI